MPELFYPRLDSQFCDQVIFSMNLGIDFSFVFKDFFQKILISSLKISFFEFHKKFKISFFTMIPLMNKYIWHQRLGLFEKASMVTVLAG